MSEQPTSITTPEPAPAPMPAPEPQPEPEPAAPAASKGQIRGYVRRDPLSGHQVVGLGIVLEVSDSAVVLVPLPPDRVLVDVDSLTG